MRRRQFIGMTALALALAGGATFAATGSTSAAPTVSTQVSAKPGHGQHGPGGQITAVSGLKITVTNPRGTETIATTSSTTFELDGASSTLAAMKAGLFIRAEGSKASDGTFTATRVIASTTKPTKPTKPTNGHGHGPGGQVASVSGTTITVTNPHGTETIATTSSTTFELDGASSTLAAMKAGLFIRAEGSKASDGTFTATRVIASTTKPARPQGGVRP